MPRDLGIGVAFWPLDWSVAFDNGCRPGKFALHIGPLVVWLDLPSAWYD